MRRWKPIIDRWVEHALVALMLAMVASVLWQILSRYLLRGSSSWTEEASRFLLIWIGMLGGAYALGQKIHLALELFRPRDRRLRRLQALAIQGVILVFSVGVLIVGGGLLVRVSFQLGQTSSALSLPIGAVYAILPISGVLTCFYGILALGEAGVESPKESPEP